MGDGANWIRSLTSHFQITKNTNVIFALDKFHFKQAIHHICIDPDFEDCLSTYVANNDKINFNIFVEELSASFPKTEQKQSIEKLSIF